MNDDGQSHDSVVLKRSQVVLGLLGGFVLLALNALQFAYVLNPRLRPDPGESLGAEVNVTNVEPRVMRLDYLRRITAPTQLRRAAEDDVRHTVGNVSQRELCDHVPTLLGSWGYVVYADVSVEGLKRRHVELSGTLYDGTRRDRLEEFGEVNVPPRELSSPTDRFVETVYVSIPSMPERLSKRFFVQLELRTQTADDGSPGTLLATGRSDPFRYFVPEQLPPEARPSCADLVAEENR
jgi:hypothetical protein